jgi:urease subunit alpha
VIVKGGMIVGAVMGDPNASIPTPEPNHYRLMFGGFGSALDSLAVNFVSGAALEAGTLSPRLNRTAVAVRNTRSVRKQDMKLNDARPNIDVNPDTFEVTIDGERITSEAATSLPLAQRYFLF